MYNILVCDDERDILEALKIYLKMEGYQVFLAEDGKMALQILKEEEIHLVLLDIMMPRMDGITAISRIREYSNVPVIFLTAKGEEVDKILGLNVGADDYITKPFLPMELLARVKSQLRRYMFLGGNAKLNEPELLKAGGIVMDVKGHEVTLDGDPLSLTPIEYDMLKLFLSRPGEVLSPQEIYREVWKENPVGAEGTVSVHIRHLREKIEIVPSNPRYIKVVWGKGYKLEKK